MGDYQKCENLTSTDVYDKSFNKTLTYACEKLYQFDKYNIKDLLNKILFPTDKNIPYSDIIFNNIKDAKFASLVSSALPVDYYNYDVELLSRLLRINYVKLVFGEVYILYNKIYDVLKLVEQKEVEACSSRKLNENLTHMIVLIGRDKNSGLINELNIVLENKNLKYCYGLRTLREKLSLMFDDLTMCKKDNKFNVDKINYDYLRTFLKDSPINYCYVIYHYYNNVKNPKANLEDTGNINTVVEPKPTNINIQDDSDSNSSVNIGAIIGGVIGGVVLLILIVYLYRRKKKATQPTP